MKWIEYNLNQTVKVKLKDEGKDMWYHQYDSWIDKTDLKRSYPETDEEGYTSMQFWKFMELYGKSVVFGKDPPFSLTVKLEVSDVK